MYTLVTRSYYENEPPSQWNVYAYFPPGGIIVFDPANEVRALLLTVTTSLHMTILGMTRERPLTAHEVLAWEREKNRPGRLPWSEEKQGPMSFKEWRTFLGVEVSI